MTQDEIIDMAKQVGIRGPVIDFHKKELEAFAKLVTAKEREACADMAEKQCYAMCISLTSHPAQNGTAVGIANQIRTRGES